MRAEQITGRQIPPSQGPLEASAYDVSVADLYVDEDSRERETADGKVLATRVVAHGIDLALRRLGRDDGLAGVLVSGGIIVRWRTSAPDPLTLDRLLQLPQLRLFEAATSGLGGRVKLGDLQEIAQICAISPLRATAAAGQVCGRRLASTLPSRQLGTLGGSPGGPKIAVIGVSRLMSLAVL